MAKDPIEALRERLLRAEAAVPTSALARLWRTGRGSAGLVRALLGGRGEPSAADVERVVRVVAQLGELKGVAMKAGQILGYIDPSLPPELRGLLALLQTSAQPTPWPGVEATLREALGARAEALLAGLERQPVAVASVGQVHRGRLPGGEEVAVKVRHPGVLQAFESDFRTAGAGPALAALLSPGAGGSVRDLVEEARTAMLEECDFALEARRQAEFGRLFAGDPVIGVPGVRAEWCAEAVLCTDWLPGLALEDYLAGRPPQAERDRLGEALFRFYLGALYQHGLFHADPHPGNYAFREGGRLAVYDFGCVRRFDRATVAALAGLARAARADDLEALCAAFAALGGRPPPARAGREHLRALVRGFFAPLLQPGPRPMTPDAAVELQQLMRDKRAVMGLELPGKLLFLFRIRFGLYAVLARLGAVADWSALELGWAEAARAGA